MRHNQLSHEFVEKIPAVLEEGRLYISIRYRTASHLCACGCGTRVVTPIKPAKWNFTYDGETVSLSPSIGRWQLPCKSHYWIRNDQVEWSTGWTDEQIERGRRRDEEDHRTYYAERVLRTDAPPTAAPKNRSLFGRLWRKVSRRDN